MHISYISLFSGIEAASVAWLPLGWKPIAFTEIDPWCCALLDKYYPDVLNLGDITKVNWSEIERPDVVIGGSPCQSFSTAGNREGLNGESRLMFEYIRAVQGIRPSVCIWENVPGALSSERGKAFKLLLRSLDEIGYGLAWRVLDAQFFGVPQRRERVFLVGCLNDPERAGEILFDAESLSWNFKKSKEKRESLTSNSRAIADKGSANGQKDVGSFCWHVGPTGSISYQTNLSNTILVTQPLAVCFAIDGDISRGARLNKNGFSINEQLSPTLTTYDIPAASYELHATKDFITSSGEDITGPLCARDFKGVGNQFVNEGKVIISKSDGYVVRKLTPIEYERLQGFPDNYTNIEREVKGKIKPIPDGQRYKMLGNSMAVPVIRWLGKRIQETQQGE